MIIDFHTHAFPEAIAARSITALKAGIRSQQGEEYEAYTDGTVGSLEECMKKCGVTKSIVLPVVTKVSQTATINAYAETIRTDSVLSFAGVHPMDENIEYTLEKIKERGFIGIKLHPEFQQSYIDSPEMMRIFKKAEEQKLYTVIHCGVDIGMPPPVHATPKRIVNVLDKVDGKYLIGAHLGGFGLWEDVKRYLVGSPMYFDTAMLYRYIDRNLYKDIIKTHGAEHILFGSDCPWESPDQTLAGLKELELSKREMELITCGNAERILGIGK